MYSRRLGNGVLFAGLLLAWLPGHGQDVPEPPQSLTHAKYPMKEEERLAVASYAIHQGKWLALSAQLRDMLLEAKKGPDFTGPGWSERLWLATVFQWLGTKEYSLAADYLRPRLANRIRTDKGPVPEEQIRKLVLEGLNNKILQRYLGHELPYLFTDDDVWPRDKPLADRLSEPTLTFLLNHPEVLEELARTVTTESDYLPGVFRVLDDLIQANPEGVDKYPKLAVALAIVYDQPLPRDWPHHQVRRDDLPLAERPWTGLMAYFIRLQEDGDLLHDLDELDTDRIKFLVDAPIRLEELDWARENIKNSRNNFDRVYHEVHYQTGRISSQDFDWNDGPYTLDNIRAQGGICVDQAYFAAIAGKSMGLPTLYFTGQGRDGGHAWMGYLRSKNRWETDIGRYATQKFVTGHAIDPQTWQPISDHQLEELTRTRPNGYKNRKSIKLLGLVNLMGESATIQKRLELLDDAIQADRGNVEVWQRKTRMLKDAGTTAYLITHLEDMSKQFHANEELNNSIQRQLAGIFEDQGDTKRAHEMREKLIKDMTRDRPDLGVLAACDMLASLIEAKQYGEFEDAYRKMIKRFGDLGGGVLFYSLIRPTVERLMKQKQTQLAVDCLTYAQEKMTGPSTDDSILGMDFAALKQRIGIRAE